jgi:uncharacterized protein (DUF486 family)
VQNLALEIRQQFESARRAVSTWLALPVDAPYSFRSITKLNKSIRRIVSLAQNSASQESAFHVKRERRNMRTVILLTISNIFMTFAWYGHLKYRTSALWKVILVSWGIAFFEYCFQVPANRIGSYEFSTAQLKTMQEVITLSVFSVFSVLYLGEKLKWNHAAGFGCIAMAVFFVFHKW